MICYSVCPFVTIAVSSAVGASFQVFQLFTYPFMPDSPYYLLLKGNPDGARKSLQRLRNREDVEEELKEITAAVERQSKEKGRPKDLIKVPSNLRAVIIMMVLNASQHFSSISVMLMNLHTILADAEGIVKPSTAAIIFSIVMVSVNVKLY